MFLTAIAIMDDLAATVVLNRLKVISLCPICCWGSVILTALAAVFAFIPLTLSVFWSSMAYTPIGGTVGGTILTLVFLPAL